MLEQKRKQLCSRCDYCRVLGGEISGMQGEGCIPCADSSLSMKSSYVFKSVDYVCKDDDLSRVCSCAAEEVEVRGLLFVMILIH